MLSDLPFEILQKIVEPLDVASARSLARTCSALSAVSESIIWRCVDITSGWDSQRDRPITLQYKIEEYRRRAWMVESKLKHAVSGIISHRSRLQWITTLRIEPGDGWFDDKRARRMVSLLRMVAPKLQRLDFLPLPTNDEVIQVTSTIGYDKLNFALEEAQIPFPKLVRLHIAFEHNEHHNYGWLLQMPNLQEIEVCSNDQYSSTSLFGKPGSQCFPHLTRLTVSNVRKDMYDRSLEVMATLVSASPNLSFLRMSGEFEVEGDERFIPAMEKSTKLKTLVIKYSREHRDIMLDGDPIIKFPLFPADLSVEEVVLDSYGWGEMRETEFGMQAIELHSAPSLHRVTLLTTPRMPLSQYVSLSLGPPPVDTGSLGSYFLIYLHKCPKLTNILLLHLERPFPSAHSAFTEPEYFVPPDRWESEGHRGMVIRQYTTTIDSKTRQFWHIRMLSRTIRNPDTRVSWVGPRRCWQDFTAYYSSRVPRDMMEKLYKINGDDPVFIEGGRELYMPQEAWDLLDEWQEKRRAEAQAAFDADAG